MFLCSLRKKHTFPPEQICLGGTFMPHYDTSQPHIFHAHLQHWSIVAACLVIPASLHNMIQHDTTQYWQYHDHKTEKRTEFQQSTKHILI
jgi:hypothetical protein